MRTFPLPARSAIPTPERILRATATPHGGFLDGTAPIGRRIAARLRLTERDALAVLCTDAATDALR